MLSGWEGPEAEGLDITVDWYEEDGIWAIFAQNLGTFNFGSYGDGPVWLTPMDASGYIYPSDGVPACMGGFTAEGERVVIGYSEETEDGVVQMTTMMYLANLQSKWYNITSNKAWPEFPFTVTPATKATTNSVSEFKVVKKGLDSHKEFKTFGVQNVMVR